MSLRVVGAATPVFQLHVERHRWKSSAMELPASMLRVGYGGLHHLVFPAVGVKPEHLLVSGFFDHCREEIHRGQAQFFCAECEYDLGWLNHQIAPRERVMRHNQYERYVIEEVLPLIAGLTGSQKLNVAGLGLGGFVSLNFALKHPEFVRRAVAMSSSFAIRNLLAGYFDEDCYFNSPFDFVPNIADERLLSDLQALQVVLVAGEAEACAVENRQMEELLKSKSIEARLLIVKGSTTGWELWKARFAGIVLGPETVGQAL